MNGFVGTKLPGLALLAALCVILSPARSDDAGARPEDGGKRGAVRGRFVLDAKGEPVAPESFRRGLQASALLWRDGVLWSVGDQRSQFPNHVFLVDPMTARLRGAPLRFGLPSPQRLADSPGTAKHLLTYSKIPNSDFEALANHPTKKNSILAVTEDKTPWIAELRVDPGTVESGVGGLQLENLTELRFPAGLEPWRKSPNFRLEGLTLSSDGKTVYFAYERAADNLPRVLKTSLSSALGDSHADLEIVDIDFASVPRRADKRRALLNLNDIQILRRGDRDLLIAVARDQERVLVIDLAAKKVTGVIDLDFRDPNGRSIHWVSPEGVAFDEENDRLWIINDPDSVRGNYKLRGEKVASGLFAQYAPLLFELTLSAVLESK